MDNKSLDMKPYEHQIEEYVKTLIENINGSITIVLYGSIARGDYNIGSDADILIISDDLPTHPLKRSELLFSLNNTNAPIEPKGYTNREFSKLIKKLNPTALDSLYEGIVLVDAGNWDDFKKEFNQVREEFELEKTRRGWISHKAIKAIREAKRA